MHDKPEEFERPQHSAEEDTERSRREMVYLLRSILEEVHNQRQGSGLQQSGFQTGPPAIPPLPAAAIAAGKLFLLIEAEIALAIPDVYL